MLGALIPQLRVSLGSLIKMHMHLELRDQISVELQGTGLPWEPTYTHSLVLRVGPQCFHQYLVSGTR